MFIHKKLHAMALMALCLSLLCGCEVTRIGDMTIYHHEDITTDPIRVAYSNIDSETLFALCKQVFEGQGIPIRNAKDGRIRSKTMRELDISWRLYVRIFPEADDVIVATYMKIHRHTDVDFDPVGSLIDSLLESGPEYELEELERDYDRGKIEEWDYRMQRQALEDEIEAEEAERRRQWEEENEERILRVTRRGREFHSMLEEYL